MTNADGLLASAALYAATLILIGIGYRYSREFVRTPAALLAMVFAAAASFLMVKHAPAGAEWQPLSWTPENPPAGPSKRLSFPVRQRSLTDGAEDGSGQGHGRLDLRGQSRGRTGEDDQPADGAAGNGGALGRVGLLAGLFSPPARRAPVAGDVIKDCPFCPEIVVVPGGRFLMGAPATDPAATEAEKPARQVSIWPGFAIGRYEVTAGEFAHFARATGRTMPACPGQPADSGGDRMPMACVSAQDAAAYAGWLRGISGKPYRLPNAAEWEYAAKAVDAEPQAARPPRSIAGPVRVETSAANAWSIHGMGGNLAELVSDCWRPNLDAHMPDPEHGCTVRILKDGAWSDAASWQRPSARRPVEATMARPTIGFRIARDLR